MAKGLRDVIVLLAAGGLAMGLLAACAGGGDESASAQELDKLVARVQQLEEQLQAAEKPAGPAVGPTIMVKPSFFKFPKGRMQEPGLIWFYGSGLEPGQWFRISMEAEGEDGDVTFAVEDFRQANASGAFALSPPEIRPDRWAVRDVFGQQGGVFNVKLWDMDTDKLLAWTPLVICGSEGENPWCGAALDTAIVPEPVVLEGAPTVYRPNRFRIEDGFFQLRMGSEPYWGYGAEDRIDSTAGDGIVMTIKLGDTIKFNRLENRTDVEMIHHFTIAELEIDIEMAPALRIEPYELKPDKAGEFVIDDSSDPGAHGKALLIVTEE